MAIITHTSDNEYKVVFDDIERKHIKQIAKMYGIAKASVVGAVLLRGFRPYIEEIHETNRPILETPNGASVRITENDGQ